MTVLFSLTAGTEMADRLQAFLEAGAGDLEQRQFPDGETYLRVATPVVGQDVLLLCALDRPDPKIPPLLFAAEAARDQGARSVGLVAPYLPYMRQDAAFRAGEAVTSQSFARLLSERFDWLATVDPHLHRYDGLESIYSIPAIAVSAAGPISEWISGNIERPFLIGPDDESRRWIERIAGLAQAPFAVLGKRRSGDFDVSLDGAGAAIPAGATPVIVDDIASTASTMVQAVRLLNTVSERAPACIIVHAVFSGEAYESLLAAGPAAVVSTNTLPHPSNAIDVSAELATAVRRLLR